MSDKAMAWARSMRVGGPSAKLVLLVLADQADDFGFVSVNLTQEAIAEEAELSVRHVRRLLQALEPFVERIHRQGTGQGRQADAIRLRMREMPAIVGARPAPPEMATGQIVRATGHPDTGNRTNREGNRTSEAEIEATGHPVQKEIPPTPPKEKLLPLQKEPLKGFPKGSPSTSFDEAWRQWPDRGRKRSSKARSLDLWRRAEAKHGPEPMLRAVRAYLADPDARKEGGEFVPALERWLAKRLETWLGEIVASSSAAEELDWPRMLAVWRDTGRWRETWGPRPDQPGYVGPPADDLFSASGAA